MNTSRKATNEYTCKYDKPQTPYARVLAAPKVPQNIKEALQRRKSQINGIELYHKTKKILHRIRKVQELSKESIPGTGQIHPIP